MALASGTRAVVVTGGAAGIGRGAVERFVQAGDRVFALDRDADALAALEAELGELVTGLVVDVGDRDALAAAAAQVGELLAQERRGDSTGADDQRIDALGLCGGDSALRHRRRHPAVGLRRGDGGQRRAACSSPVSPSCRRFRVGAVWWWLRPFRRTRRSRSVAAYAMGKGASARSGPGDGGGSRRRRDPGQRGVPGLGGHSDAADLGRAVRRWTVDGRCGRGVGTVASARAGWRRRAKLPRSSTSSPPRPPRSSPGPT